MGSKPQLLIFPLFLGCLFFGAAVLEGTHQQVDVSEIWHWPSPAQKPVPCQDQPRVLFWVLISPVQKHQVELWGDAHAAHSHPCSLCLGPEVLVFSQLLNLRLARRTAEMPPPGQISGAHNPDTQAAKSSV